MIDPNSYFGPPPEKAPPETEEEKVAAFRAIKAKLAAADPAVDINRIARRAQKKADEAKTTPTKARHLSLAIGDLELLKKDYLADHPASDLPVGSEEYLAAIDFTDAADRAIAHLHQAIERLELEAEEEGIPDPELAPSMQTPPADASAYPDQMDAEQVAQYIHRNKDTVYRYAREGKLPAQWIDTHPLFAKKDIDEWLAAHPTPAMPKRARKRTL
jgi:excisionase family DNA binding protein